MARRRRPPVPSDRLAILLISGTHDRAHYAFVLAAGAAALGRSVVVFATNRGCHALLADWSGLEDAGRDATVRARGVAGLDELRAAAQDLGVELIACEAGLAAEDLRGAALCAGVRVEGVASFLSAAGSGPIVSL